MPAPAPASAAMDWQATQTEKITDIAAIQPTLSNLEEEKNEIAASSGLMNTKAATSKPAAKFCGPETTVRQIFLAGMVETGMPRAWFRARPLWIFLLWSRFL